MDTSTPQDLDYASYNLWVVVDFDPISDPKRMGYLLGLYRQELRAQDPHVQWLSDRWRASPTDLPPQAYTEDEPPGPPPHWASPV